MMQEEDFKGPNEGSSEDAVSLPSEEEEEMSKSRLHYIPIVLFFFFPVTFFICYLIALQLGHINPYFAYISDAGTIPPEQHVFSQLVNMGAALFAYFTYIRYIQVEQYMKIRFEQSTPIGNVIALAFGFTSALGMSLVGNFPELIEKEVHLIGAFLAFVGGSIYVVFQGYLTFKMLPHFQSKAVAYVRTFIGILGLMLYFGAQSTVVLAFQQVKNKAKLENSPQSLKWGIEDGGYQFRAASVIMEWLLLSIFDIFVLTFVTEFKKFKMEAPSVKFLIDVKDVQEEVSFDATMDESVGGTIKVETSSDFQIPVHLDNSILLLTGSLNSSRGASGQSSYHGLTIPSRKASIIVSNKKI